MIAAFIVSLLVRSAVRPDARQSGRAGRPWSAAPGTASTRSRRSACTNSTGRADHPAPADRQVTNSSVAEDEHRREEQTAGIFSSASSSASRRFEIRERAGRDAALAAAGVTAPTAAARVQPQAQAAEPRGCRVRPTRAARSTGVPASPSSSSSRGDRNRPARSGSCASDPRQQRSPLRAQPDGVGNRRRVVARCARPRRWPGPGPSRRQWCRDPRR